MGHFYLRRASSYLAMGILSANIMIIAEIWGLFEFPIAAVIGARPSQEEE